MKSEGIASAMDIMFGNYALPLGRIPPEKGAFEEGKTTEPFPLFARREAAMAIPFGAKPQ